MDKVKVFCFNRGLVAPCNKLYLTFGWRVCCEKNTVPADEFCVCKPCIFENECCACKTCMKLRSGQFLEKVVKVANDFNDLRIVSFEILSGYGGESNHDEVLAIINKDQSEKAISLLSEVAMMINDLLKTVSQQGFVSIDVAKAKQLAEKVNVFLDKAVNDCKKTFSDFQEPLDLVDVMKIISSPTFFQTKSA